MMPQKSGAVSTSGGHCLHCAKLERELRDLRRKLAALGKPS